MTYVVSDIHGYYDKYIDLLRKIGFGPNDALYVLGDVIDRGPDGFKILLDMAQRPNVINLLGNHEVMAIDTLPRILRSVQPDGSVELSEEDAKAVERWFYNGGELSLADPLAQQRPDADRMELSVENAALSGGERRRSAVYFGTWWFGELFSFTSLGELHSRRDPVVPPGIGYGLL